MDSFPSDSDGLIRRRLVVAGFGDDDGLARAVRDGSLIRVRRGSYTSVDTDPDALGRLQILAAAGDAIIEKAVSHHSAAALHGLDTLDDDSPPRGVHFSVRRANGGDTRTRLLHPTRWDPDEVVMIDDVLTTSIARTAVDIARQGSWMSALVVFDSALRLGVTKDDLRSVIQRSRGRTGVGAARAALPYADGRAESVAESLSRGLIISFHDIPTPTLQHVIRDGDGRELFRLDFLWDKDRVVGECDGRRKFEQHLRPGESVADRHWHAKERDEALMDLGLFPVHWGWRELMNPEKYHHRLVRAFDRAHRRFAA
ncbi:type IV toxin-antitoxin system AbiEi family antitoxin domain-containing protein [Williamsia sterculiae]|uniref:Transcriptional regulator, AbiEi antitoxin, Type IV TA system n=1 Tax=Williamsia sterculiae TaxID=1344003 RepID=A0A1N7CYA5_9NOCA|nr:hypothetical protein [Williamsia sterculiae]SIR68563.1 Transcriptional regulator, AbiEi antitoxin, Type IV TA system [Williamsia sterculiae]